MKLYTNQINKNPRRYGMYTSPLQQQNVKHHFFPTLLCIENCEVRCNTSLFARVLKKKKSNKQNKRDALVVKGNHRESDNHGNIIHTLWESHVHLNDPSNIDICFLYFLFWFESLYRPLHILPLEGRYERKGKSCTALYQKAKLPIQERYTVSPSAGLLLFRLGGKSRLTVAKRYPHIETT